MDRIIMESDYTFNMLIPYLKQSSLYLTKVLRLRWLEESFINAERRGSVSNCP